LVSGNTFSKSFSVQPSGCFVASSVAVCVRRRLLPNEDEAEEADAQQIEKKPTPTPTQPPTQTRFDDRVYSVSTMYCCIDIG